MRPATSGAASRTRSERGQVLVIFAGGIVLFMLLLAVVLDVSWYWANTLRVQRAADAAALAGAVYLPGNRTTAYASARAEAQKNGYTNGANATVTPIQDGVNPRQLNVEVSANVNTYFMRVIGISTIRATRASKAEYVLPVPMGSPQNYYGVGFFQGVQPGTTSTVGGATEDTGEVPGGRATGNDGGGWAGEGNAYGNDNAYTTEGTNGDRSIWRGFDLLGGTRPIPNDATLQIRGIQVFLTDASLTGSGTATNCRVDVEASWNAGSSWSSVRQTDPLGTNADDDRTVGTAIDVASWGTHTWTRDDLSDANFRVRLTWRDGTSGCADTRSVQVDLLEVRVHYTTSVTTPTTYPVLSVPDPAGGTLPTQGFWGAIFTSGGVRENGDRYAPLYIGGNNPPDGTNGGPNPDYDPNGYDYTVEVGSGGEVRLFDPIFCATGRNLSGGWFGTGDHWTNDGTGGGENVGPVSVRFRLYNTNGTPYTGSDDTQVGSDWTHDPGTATLGDFSGNFSRSSSPPQNSTNANRQDCANNPAHNQWVLPTGWTNLTAGTYRVNVNTNLGQNATFGAENLFSIWVTGSGRARVYGGGRMAAYTNLDDTGVGGAQRFYFSQIEPVHAGKTMVITLFDPGEASAPSYLQFLSPERNTYDYARFDWSSNDGRSGTNVTEIQTSDGSSFFNNRILTIEIALPTDYGTGGLDPNGLGEDGWWLVEYDVRAGNDTTTWEVEIRGNPVHLKVP